jgi:GrpB-like predicted nucleotidyltransferase (UPF0157 family)
MAELDASIRIVPYDSAWPSLFETERDLLRGLLAPWLTGPIEHIGSTSVPGMPAKRIIDMMAAVKDLNASREAIPTLENVTYCYAPYRADVEHWFCKPRPSARTHHLHLVPYGSPLWNETLIFRDRLRREPAIAARYIALKLRLAQAHPMDREAYTEGKMTFVFNIVRGTSGD